jgi:hypothetical protein
MKTMDLGVATQNQTMVDETLQQLKEKTGRDEVTQEDAQKIREEIRAIVEKKSVW